MHACFKLDIEEAHSQAFQQGGYLGGEGGTTGESRNVAGMGSSTPAARMGSRGPEATQGSGTKNGQDQRAAKAPSVGGPGGG